MNTCWYHGSDRDAWSAWVSGPVYTVVTTGTTNTKGSIQYADVYSIDSSKYPHDGYDYTTGYYYVLVTD